MKIIFLSFEFLQKLNEREKKYLTDSVQMQLFLQVE